MCTRSTELLPSQWCHVSYFEKSTHFGGHPPHFTAQFDSVIARKCGKFVLTFRVSSTGNVDSKTILSIPDSFASSTKLRVPCNWARANVANPEDISHACVLLVCHPNSEQSSGKQRHSQTGIPVATSQLEMWKTEHICYSLYAQTFPKPAVVPPKALKLKHYVREEQYW